MEKKLSLKERTFVKEYLVDLNATQAALRANYSKRSARQLASRMLTKDYIQAAIAKERAKREKRTEYDQDFVINSLVEIVALHKVITPGPAVRAIELLGKHNGMFTDKLKLSGDADNPLFPGIDIRIKND